MHKWLSQQGYYHRHMASTSPKANVQIDTICEAEANGVVLVECLFGGISERLGATLSSHRGPLSRHRCLANALTGHTYHTKMSRSSN